MLYDDQKYLFLKKQRREFNIRMLTDEKKEKKETRWKLGSCSRICWWVQAHGRIDEKNMATTRREQETNLISQNVAPAGDSSLGLVALGT